MASKEIPKVSIIIPIHNAEKTLEKCISSIVEQEYANIELILIENGSTDNSKIMCMEIGERYDNIKVEIDCAEGASRARNEGLSLATGDIIGFCDADDFLETDAIKVIVETFQQEPDIICTIGAFYRGKITQGRVIKKYQGLDTRCISVKEAQLLTLGSDLVMGSVWNKYYKAEVLHGFKFDSDLSYCEDMHFNIKVLSSFPENTKVMLIDKALYCYMENEQSVTHQEDKLFDDKNELKYISAMKAIARECSVNRKIYSILKMKVACFSIDIMVDMKLNEIQKRKLIKELKDNYYYLVSNVWRFNWKWNWKRLYYGTMILIQDKLNITGHFI